MTCDCNPCQNEGSCFPYPKPFACKCKEGFVGIHCQIGMWNVWNFRIFVVDTCTNLASGNTITKHALCLWRFAADNPKHSQFFKWVITHLAYSQCQDTTTITICIDHMLYVFVALETFCKNGGVCEQIYYAEKQYSERKCRCPDQFSGNDCGSKSM